MKLFRLTPLLLALAACSAPEPAATSGTATDTEVDEKRFVDSVLYEVVAGQCASFAPQGAAAMQQAYTVWLTANAASIERGAVAWQQRLQSEAADYDAQLAQLREDNARRFAGLGQDARLGTCRNLYAHLGDVDAPVVVGDSIAQRELLRDVMSVLRPRLEAALDCPRLDHVRTQTVAMFDRPELADDGAIRSGRIVESWTASGCNNSEALYVDFRPRGAAGTDFEILEEMPVPDIGATGAPTGNDPDPAETEPAGPTAEGASGAADSAPGSAVPAARAPEAGAGETTQDGADGDPPELPESAASN